MANVTQSDLTCGLSLLPARSILVNLSSFREIYVSSLLMSFQSNKK
jgi:hypothetical protein